MSNAPKGGRVDLAAGKQTWTWAAWLSRPLPFLALCVVAAAGLALANALYVGEGWSLIKGDHGPKRWRLLLKPSKPSEPSDCYTNLLSQQQPPSGPCFHREDEPIASWRPDWSQPHVSVYSVTPAPRTLATLRDLGDRGQEQAIRFLENNASLKAKAWIDLQEALNYSASSESGEKDPFRSDRVLVATVAKGLEWDPGDRMMWTRIFVQPINFWFDGYSVAATDNETVKIAGLEATSSRKFSANLNATIPGMEAPKASLGADAERGVKTTAEINAQYEKLGIDITRRFLRIIRESESGGDAVGNTTVALTAVTDARTIWKQFPADDCNSRAASTAPRKVSVNDKCHLGPLVQTEGENVPDSKPPQLKDEDLVLLVTGFHPDDEPAPLGGDHEPPSESNKANAKPVIDVLPQVPVPHCPLLARVWMLYEERKVDDGTNNFYDESQQDVELIRGGEDKADVEVTSADEVSPAVWSLRICDTGECDNKPPELLQAAVKGKDPKAHGVMRNVVFTDYGKAVKVAHWLRNAQQESLDRSGYTFSYPGGAQDSKQALVPYKNTRDECKPAGNANAGGG